MFAVLGAGITGLSVALKASEEGLSATVIEKAPHVGGMASSFVHSFEGKEYILDYGPHKIYTTLPRSLGFMKNVLDGDLLEKPKKAKIRFQGKYFEYPIKIGEILFGLGIPQTVQFGASFAASMVSSQSEETYKGYLEKRFGRKIYETIFRDLAQKVWGDPETLDAELAKARLAAKSLPEMVSKLLLPQSGGREISAKVFYYPKFGIGQLSDEMAHAVEKKGGTIFLSSQPSKIQLQDGKAKSISFSVKGSKGDAESQVVEPEFVFSTIPLSDLVSLFSPKAPEEVLNAASRLKYRSLILLYVIARKERLFDDSFIFFPEKEFVFNRLSEQKGFSEYCGPKETTVLCAEISTDAGSRLYEASDKEIFEFAWPSLEKTGFIERKDVASFFTKRSKRVYPVYDLGFKKNLRTVLDWLDGIENLFTLGRQGLFNYNNTDHCVDMALSAFDNLKVNGMRRSLPAWKKERERFENYVIVD